MKHLYLSLILCLCYSLPSLAQDNQELTIGVKAGINFYNISPDDLVEDDDTGLSTEFGVYGRIGDTFFVQPELNFVNHKVHLITLNQTRPGERDDVVVRYLRLPVYLGYRTGYDGPVFSKARFLLGPSVSYALGVADNNIGVERSDIHNVQFALNGGAGVELWLLRLDLMYHHYFTSLLNDGRSSGKGRAVSVTAALEF